MSMLPDNILIHEVIEANQSNVRLLYITRANAQLNVVLMMN